MALLTQFSARAAVKSYSSRNSRWITVGLDSIRKQRQ